MVSWLQGSHGYWDGSLVLFSLPRISHGIATRITKDTTIANAPTSILAATEGVIVIHVYFGCALGLGLGLGLGFRVRVKVGVRATVRVRVMVNVRVGLE